ncbi:hypothetical protein [Phocaeicola vulgatus]|uniref:hypothetical protein n=2 Tax=Bacteroidaceae TaxID=815 RepID=UPI003218DF5B
MRKFFLGAALVAASFGMAQSADAATVMDVEGVSTVLAISDYEGTYNGTMDKIKMKGKDYEPRAASYTLEGGLLTCDFPQIGSMPGTITIELNVNVDEETGEITADSGVDAGYLTILGMDLVKLKLDSLTDAKVTGNTIEFTLAVSGKFLGADFPASVHLLEQNNSSLFCQATKLNSERVRRKLSNGFLLALFLCVTKKKLSQYIHLTQWGRHHYPVGKAAMPLKTLPVCNRRRGNKIIQTA